MPYAATLLIIKILEETADYEVEPTSEHSTDTGLPGLMHFKFLSIRMAASAGQPGVSSRFKQC